MKDEYLEIVKLELGKDSKRYLHTISVYQTAIKIARQHQISEEEVEIASLFHDLFKNKPYHEQLEYLDDLEKIEVAGIANAYHGYAAANYLKCELNITNVSILNAIRYHTLGAIELDDVGKVLFISDVCEPSRAHQYCDEIYLLSCKDLDEGLLKALKVKMEYAKIKGFEIASITRSTYEYYKEKKMNKISKKSELDLVIEILEELKVNNLSVYDFENSSPFYQYFVIATVNDRQGNAAITHLKKAIPDAIRNTEGKSGWILIDAGLIIIHLFKIEEREYYGFDERLLAVKKIK